MAACGAMVDPHTKRSVFKGIGANPRFGFVRKKTPRIGDHFAVVNGELRVIHAYGRVKRDEVVRNWGRILSLSFHLLFTPRYSGARLWFVDQTLNQALKGALEVPAITAFDSNQRRG